MAFEIKKIGEQMMGLWQGLSLVRRAILAGALLMVLGVSVYVAMLGRGDEYAVLFSNVPAQDAAKVLDDLRAKKVVYRLSRDGTTIEVPKDKVHELRIALASEGLPSGGGIGFEVFDKQTFGTTSFVEQMNYRRALAGELSRTIMSLDAVEHARVHIAMKERSLYRKSDSPPSASVVVKLKRAQALDRSQVAGIVNLVASSVEGLTTDRVTVVNDEGSVLWSEDGEHAPAEAQREIEQRLTRRATDIVDRVVGPGNSVVVVTVELDTAHTERTEELYGNEGTALRSEAVTEERTDAAGSKGVVGGISGVRGNLAGSARSQVEVVEEPSEGAGQREGHMKVASTRNFEVSRVVNHTKGPKARIGRLHVAVLINSTARSAVRGSSTSSGAKASVAGANEANAGANEANTGVAEATAAPSDPSGGASLQNQGPDLGQLARLIREATGLDPGRGDRLELQSLPFASDVEVAADLSVEGPSPEPLWWQEALEKYGLPKSIPLSAVGAAAGALVLFVTGVAWVLGARRRRKERTRGYDVTTHPITAQAMEDALLRASETGLGSAAGGLEAGHGALALPEPTPRERAIEAVRANPELAARVLSVWVTEIVVAPAEPKGVPR